MSQTLDFTGFVTYFVFYLSLKNSDLLGTKSQKQDKTDNSLQTTVKTVIGAINEVNSHDLTKMTYLVNSTAYDLNKVEAGILSSPNFINRPSGTIEWCTCMTFGPLSQRFQIFLAASQVVIYVRFEYGSWGSWVTIS